MYVLYVYVVMHVQLHSLSKHNIKMHFFHHNQLSCLHMFPAINLMHITICRSRLISVYIEKYILIQLYLYSNFYGNLDRALDL